ncbi:MAG: glycosyltransferase family 4 protein [Bryobacteraceae bacterium]|jgi:glycosyltransferase involved in cell wall biosynthesis
MTPFRLLAIIEAYSITGPAKNLLEFARRATEQNVFTTIATFTRGPSHNQFTQAVLEAASRYEGIALETIPERGPFDPGTLLSLRALAVRARPDVIQTHAVKSHFLARSAGLPRQAPWVAFHHGYTWPSLKARAYNQLDRWSLRSAKKVLTVSLPFRDQLAAFGVPPERIEIIHNAIPAAWGAGARELEEAARLRASAGIAPDRKVVLIVGRLSHEKDHLTLLEAVNRLRATVMPHLVIVGEGPEKSRIEERMRQLGLDNYVTFTGHQNSAEPWYGIADVAVLSSLSEGSPNALLEAMATNVPIVATAVGGVPEIVTHDESALLIDPGDPESMSAAIARLLTEPGLAERLKKRSRQLILERHEPEARTRKLVSIYRSLVELSPRSQAS